MRKISCFLFVLIMVIVAGCQQAQQTKSSTADISRKDRLIANENMGLKNELEQCRKEVAEQKTLLQQCQTEKEKEALAAGESIKWLLDELPADLLKEVETLSKQNEELAKKVEQLENELKQTGQAQK